MKMGIWLTQSWHPVQQIREAIWIIRTSQYKPKEPHYSNDVAVSLPSHTDDTRQLAKAKAALMGLKRIYRPGFNYQKAGVMLSLIDRQEHGTDDTDGQYQ